MSLLSFDANDPSLNHATSEIVRNKAGRFGAYVAGFLNDVFGVGAFIWPFFLGMLGAAYIAPAYALQWWRWCGIFLLIVFLHVISAAWDISIGDIRGGGMIGATLYKTAGRYLSSVGSSLIWFFVLVTGIQLTCDISWVSILSRSLAGMKALAHSQKENAQPAPQALFDEESKPNGKDRPVALMQWLSRLRDRLGGIRPLADAIPPLSKDKEEASAPSCDEQDDDVFARVEVIRPGEDGEADLDIRPHGKAHDAPETLPGGAAPEAELSDAVRTAEKKPFTECGTTQQESLHPIGERQQAKVEAPVQRPVASPSSPAAHPQGAQRNKALIPLPGLDLLIPPRPTPAARGENIEARGKDLMDCLNNFAIEGELVRITPGPVVTRYEVRPAPGIRVAAIVKLSDDLTRALKASAIRIQAPVPGTDTVGIEIPNEHRETVNFRELASSEAFRKGCGPLTMILGKDITGRPYMADLTRMPHMLVAGATGAGKSVCLNSILVSFLYRTQPSDLRLLLVDPKRIEMAVYADEPHLVHPVVTEMEDAKNALDWAVHEMDERYKTLQRLGVRNIEGYNQKLASYHGRLPDEIADLEPLPYLVIVIDELADLMMTVRREAEDRIVRLAQLARAAGIHMILATQRPSVDVVTGLIKANFPCRISFQVTSRHDSRTILDQEGAQHLLGRGDMLFKPASGPVQRLHGPFLSDDEVQAVVQHWKHFLTPTYKVDFTQWSPEATGNGGVTDESDADDSLYGEVVNFVTEQGRASISLIQRRFKIGFNRSARLVEQLERDGIIGPADGSKPRLVKK